jgi:hypothetical protein
MKKQNKLLVHKLDFLWKHVGQKKASITSMGVVVEDFTFWKLINMWLNCMYKGARILFANK